MVSGTIWSNGIVNFNICEGIPSINLTDAKPWHKATEEEILSLESTSLKMPYLIREVSGIPDHAIWSLRNQEIAKLIIIFGKSSRNAPLCLDVARKVAMMQFALQKGSFELIKIDNETIDELATKAPLILDAPIYDCSIDLRKYGWKNIPQAISLLQKSVALPELWENLCDADEGAMDPACKVFCHPSIIEKQHIVSTKNFHVVTNVTPYVNFHVMVIPKKCIRKSNEYSNEELLEKNKIIQRLTSIFLHRFKVPMVGALTRLGSLGGQTQPHLHHHILGFDPKKEHFWVRNWTAELLQKEAYDTVYLESNKHLQCIIPPLFKRVKVVVFDLASNLIQERILHYIHSLKHQNYRIGLLSNTHATHYVFNKEKALIDIFDFEINSHQTSLTTLNREIFENICSLTGLEPAAHLLIDDVEENIDAAHEIGFHGILYKEVVMTIDNIDELLNSNSLEDI